MNSKILHPAAIETATVKIKCGDKTGTAFCVHFDKERQLFLTAEHNIPVDKPIEIFLNDGTVVPAELTARIAEHDAAIITTTLSTATNLSVLALKNLQIPYDEHWETFGFPVERINSGGRYNGTVSRINTDTKWDVDLNCAQYNNLQDFAGLSGSALIIDGFATGIINYDNAGTLGATSIRSIAEILTRHGITVLANSGKSIPDSIEADIADSTPNHEVLEKINAVIAEQFASGFFLVTGSPGSGKTTIAAQLSLSDKNHLIVDRFFVKVPDSDEFPTTLRATPEFFMRWLEEVCYRALFNNPPPKPSKDSSLNDRLLNIHRLIQQLSAHYQQQGKTGFLVVDGLDDVSESKMEDFLSAFPQVLSANIKIIFSCTSREVLPAFLRQIIPMAAQIKVTPLSIRNAETFLAAQLEEKKLTGSQLSELAQKSEGHPLYMRYLIKYILETAEVSGIDNWIDSIPVIGGEIENYYNKIWQQLETDTEEIWLAGTLARLRIPVEKEILPELLPASGKHHFITSFRKIQHLLRDKDLVSIYHSSFSDFINEKTRDIDKQVHTNIADFIRKHPATIFAISERVYHLSRGDEQAKRSSIEQCNQLWVDDCALNSINPDIVLADIKDIISLAAAMGIAHKVISLLLLSQRVNFRYNTLFQENAVFLVNALLALHKPQEAIRYVVRNKTLITSDGDALYLLQKFYEYDAKEEAAILLETINQTCRNIHESGFDNDTFTRYTDLKFSAVTLSSNADFENAFHQFGHLKKTVVKILKQSGNPKEVVHHFLDQIGAYNSGYFIWRFNIPPVTKQTEDKFKFDDRSSGFIALSIYQALDFQEKSPKRKASDNIAAWIKDLEYVIDKYQTNPDYEFIILHILLGRSARLDIIERLYQKLFPGKENVSFRKDNGVDLDHRAVHRLTLQATCEGFLDTSNQFPDLPAYGFSYDNWEEAITGIFTYTCFLYGKIKRYLTDGKPEDIKSLDQQLKDLLKKLLPDLRGRMNWKRSYALPELIYPVICKALINLLMDGFPDEILPFAETIVQKKNYQLGLYTEGYTDSLFVLARELAKNSKHEIPAFKITSLLEAHVVSTVENRSERNEYLLRLVELYALLNNGDKASVVFKEMISSSMGPSWYKEAQLGIINTAVSNIVPQDGDQSYLQKFAAHLQHASGEMTFQRYIKQQQEEFAGDMARIGLLNKSISYLKYLLLPDYTTVIANAESAKADMPYTGYGYVLGARAIEEQSSVLNILRNIYCSGSLIAWGLTELFIPGDDRYLYGFAEVQAKILNDAEINDPVKLELLFKRLSRFVVTEVSDDSRQEYFRELFKKLSTSNFEKIQPYLQAVGMSAATAPDNETSTTQTSGQKKEDDPLDVLIKAKEEARKKLDAANKTGARKIIVEALEKVQNQKYGIWSFNYSHKIDEIRDLFAESYVTPADFIKDIKNLIINEPYFEEWIIASQIIQLFRNIGDEQEKQSILSAVLEHIDLMVRTAPAACDGYGWLAIKTPKVDRAEQDKLLLELLIWLLNHPLLIVKNRTTEVLTWLGTVMPESIVSALVTEITREGYQISKELSAAVIHQLAALNQEGFANTIETVFEKNEQSLLALKHFMIKHALLDALNLLKSKGAGNLDNLIIKFEKTYSTSVKKRGEVVMEEKYLEPIASYLYELNELNILSKEFAVTLLDQVKTMAPVSIQDSQKASSYIDRSFNDHNDMSVIPDYNTILRYALNIAISSCAALDNKEQIAAVLRFYQPTFPENKLQGQIKPMGEVLEAAAKDFFEGQKLEIEKFLLNGHYPLDYLYRRHSESRQQPDEKITLTSYLIPQDKYSEEGHSYSYPTFPANNYPSQTDYKWEEEDDEAIPLFMKSTYAESATGSELVPAAFTPGIDELVPEITSNAIFVYWRRGRNWELKKQGVAQQTGYYTTIAKETLETLRGKYKLVWEINRGYEYRYIDVFEQKEITG